MAVGMEAVAVAVVIMRAAALVAAVAAGDPALAE
jgi:hypothetical protein